MFSCAIPKSGCFIRLDRLRSRCGSCLLEQLGKYRRVYHTAGQGSTFHAQTELALACAGSSAIPGHAIARWICRWGQGTPISIHTVTSQVGEQNLGPWPPQSQRRQALLECKGALSGVFGGKQVGDVSWPADSQRCCGPCPSCCEQHTSDNTLSPGAAISAGAQQQPLAQSCRLELLRSRCHSGQPSAKRRAASSRSSPSISE